VPPEPRPPGLIPPDLSPLLADPDWVEGFRGLVEAALAAARSVRDNPRVSHLLRVTGNWRVGVQLEYLHGHLMRVIRDPEGPKHIYSVGPRGPGPGATPDGGPVCAVDAVVHEAYCEAWAMFEEMEARLREHPDRAPIPVSGLEAIHGILAGLPEPAPPDLDDETPPGSEDQPKPPDPLAETLRILQGCGRAAKIVCYLARCEDMKAHLDDIAVAVYGYRRVGARHARKSLRTQVNRTGERLDLKGAPLRVTIDDNVAYLTHATDQSKCIG
jgi:hypothetical protein